MATTARKACMFCIMEHGLKGSDLASLPETDDELYEHLERVHHIPVQREDETEQQAMERFWTAYPEAHNPATCKCQVCTLNRLTQSL